MSAAVVNVPGLDRIVRLGMADFEQLNEDDSFRFLYYMQGIVHGMDDAYYQYRMGTLDEDRWLILRGHLQGFGGSPGIVQWWRAHRSVLSPEFVALVSEILGEQPSPEDR